MADIQPEPLQYQPAETEELQKQKEGSPPGSYFSSLHGAPILNRMTAVGLYACPSVGFYPYVTQFDIQTKCILEAPGRVIQLPPELRGAMVAGGVVEFDFFFVISDISQVQLRKKNNIINCMQHTWVHPDITNGSKLGYGKKWSMGCFAYEGCGVGPVPNKVDLAIQMLSSYELHIHPQKGGMCLSPNNCKLDVDREQPVCFFWLVTIEEVEQNPRCSVTLHWIMNSRNDVIDSIFTQANNLDGMLQMFGNSFPEAPWVRGLQFSFGVVPELALVPLPQAKKAPPQQRKRGAQSEHNKKIECERCGKKLGGNLEAHQQGRKCREAWAQKQRS